MYLCGARAKVIFFITLLHPSEVQVPSVTLFSIIFSVFFVAKIF
jgi:hypothetical protein